MTKLYKGTIQYHIMGAIAGTPDIAIGHSTWNEYNSAPPSHNENIIPLASINSAKKQKVTFDIDETEFNEIKAGKRALFLWSMPAADCSIKTPKQDKYSGLARVHNDQLVFITHSATKQGYSGELRTKANFIAIQLSAIEWTAKTMTANLAHPKVNEIRKAKWGHTGNQPPKSNTKEATMVTMGHPNDSYEQSGLKGVGKTMLFDTASMLYKENPFTAGDWDLKPQIYSKWGNKLRLGNENWVLNYDHLSNIHYGYIAAASGMSTHAAIKLAGIEVLGNTEDPEDEWATAIGNQLYYSYPNGITGQQLWQELKSQRGKSYTNIYSSRGVSYKVWLIQKLTQGRFK